MGDPVLTPFTLMLQNGDDLGCAQQMRGHARLNTTEIHTHVNIQKLIEVCRQKHPAKLPETQPCSGQAAG